MAFSFSRDTKFATLHFAHMAVADDYGNPTPLQHDLSVHRAPLFELGADCDRDIGERSANYFRNANLAFMASARSKTPTIRDEEWQRLDQRLFMLFYAVLMYGIPNFWEGLTASGGTIGDRAVVLQVARLPPFYRTAHAMPPRVAAATLHGAERVVGGLITTYVPGNDFVRVRRGIGALIAAWKASSLADRLHGCVRALDALMKLPQGRSRREFTTRLPTFAVAPNIADIADALYRLRSYDEHLGEWPMQLNVAIGDRPEFVARHAFYAEVIANFVYRTLLADAALLPLFRTDATVDLFWSTGTTSWTQQIDLGTEATRFSYDPQ